MKNLRLKSEFKMTKMGQLSYFLGIKFKKNNRGYFVHQKKYINNMLKRFKMETYNETRTPNNIGVKLI